MEPRRRLTDPDALKALAHPTRMALLGALVTEGPLTASQAAELVGESPSNCSWHLRKLAEHGFVREAQGGTGRNRPWEAAQQGLEWDEGEVADPAARVAADTLTDALLDREVQRLRAARANPDESPEWLAGHRDHPEPAVADGRGGRGGQPPAAGADVRARRAAPRPGKRPEGARLVSLVGWVVPSGSHRVAARRVRHRHHTGRGSIMREGFRHPRLHPALRRADRLHVRRLADADRAQDVGQDADRLQRCRRPDLPVADRAGAAGPAVRVRRGPGAPAGPPGGGQPALGRGDAAAAARARRGRRLARSTPSPSSTASPSSSYRRR